MNQFFNTVVPLYFFERLFTLIIFISFIVELICRFFDPYLAFFVCKQLWLRISLIYRFFYLRKHLSFKANLYTAATMPDLC
jgi:hypothetical protein